MDALKERELSIRLLATSSLKPYPGNARTHSKHQIQQIADSIQAFGFTSPVLIDRAGSIVAGHGRVKAAELLGIHEVPTIRLEDLSPQQIRAYVIADNKLAENAGWDRSILAIELGQLLEIESADFDVTVTGFEVPEIDLILKEAREGEGAEDPIPEPNLDQPAVTEAGDSWVLGKHRILCGNALEEEAYETLMGHRRATVVFTDPPFNVRIDGNTTGFGATHYREFPMASGEMTEAEYAGFLDKSLALLSRYSAANSVHYISIDWRHVGELLSAGKQSYDEYLNLCVWVKDSGGMGSFYRSQHELVGVFRKGKGRHQNNVQLGRFGRYRTNVWRYPGVKSFSKQSEEGNLLALHPTVKPVAMIADAIFDCSRRGDLVLDAFLGSGTTLMAAERTGRVCYGIELDPLYVDTAIRRWQSYTGDRAIHGVSGKRFDEVADERSEATRG